MHVGKSICSRQFSGVVELRLCALEPSLCYFQPHVFDVVGRHQMSCMNEFSAVTLSLLALLC